MEEINKIKEEQLSIHRKFVREGWYYKLIGILAIYPLMYLFYIIYDPEQDKRGRMDNGMVILYLVLIGLAMAATIAFTNPVKFINDHRVRRQNRLFKKKYFGLVLEQIPELELHNPVHKIHPSLFRQSGLFSKYYEAYTGDDFMSGSYLGKYFELGELHVFNTIITIFRGMYLVVFLREDVSAPESKLEAIRQTAEFKVLHARNQVELAFREQRFYLAVSEEEQLFENHDKKNIDKLSADFIFLEQVIALGKKSVDILKSEDLSA